MRPHLHTAELHEGPAGDLRPAASRTVLLIAFHFPPIQGSSGWQRTLRFAQHLPAFGWRPIVLTVRPWAYESWRVGAGNELPEGLEVHRAFGLDSARHLSLFGRYPGWLSVPDRWATWRPWAVSAAVNILRRRRVDAVWSTFPIATAHAVGLTVARRSGLPWIAEFRDPMWQGDYPPEPAMNDAWRKLETQIFALARAVVVTTRGAVATYAERFPTYDTARLALIENGYDEETFRRAEARLGSVAANDGPSRRPLKLLHSGIVYRSERDPTQLFAALAGLKRRGAVTAADLRVVFRACGDEQGYRRDVARLGIDDIVQIEPAVDYVAALNEMLTSDALLILQAANCNAQVPAKVYEYLRARRPILALTDPAGDTASVLEDAGAGTVARLDSVEDIERALPRFLEQVRDGRARLPSVEAVERHSRQRQAGQLARLLEQVAGCTPSG